MRFWLITPLVFLSFGFSSQSVWQFHSISGHLTDIGRLVAHPHQADIVFFTSSGALYKANLQTQQSSLLFTFPSSDAFVRDLIFFGDTIYAATNSGVYAISENGRGELIFQASEGERPCRSLAVMNKTLFIGTSSGVKYRSAETSSWTILSGPFRNQPVTCLRSEDSFLYIAANQKITRYDSRAREFKDILSAPGSSMETQEPDSDLEGIPYDIASRDVFLGFDTDGHNAILALNDSGVWSSADHGDSWKPMPAGSSPTEINNIRVVHSNGQPYVMAATNRGMMYLSDGRWQSLRDGMEAVSVNDVIQTVDGRILGATSRGIFILTERKTLSDEICVREGLSGSNSEYALALKNDPAVQEVQAMAIDYAEVHPDKILGWRKQARARSILPAFSVGLDRSATELFHWDSGANPDQIVRGRDFVDWDVSLSWDLGDLIWSTDQTSIDSRSKLVVELREEVLNQVTRIYFERKRLQYQLAQLDEEDLQFETDLKVQELTALLDGFTGGRFSQAAAGKK